MRILFILPEYYPHSGGGISTYYMQYLKALAPKCKKIKVIVGSAYTQSNDNYVIDGIEIEYLRPAFFQEQLSKFKKLNLFPEYRNSLASAWAMYEQANKGNDYDLIECTDFGHGYIPWLVLHEKPVVVRLHGSNGQIEINEPNQNQHLIGDLNRQTELILLNESDSIVTYSKANQLFWQQIFPQRKVQLIDPIFTFMRPDPIEKENFGIVCGRIQQWKGPDILCQAMSSLSLKDISLRWYGRDTAYSDKIGKSEYLKATYKKVWEKTILPQPALSQNEISIVQTKAKFAIVPSTWDMFNFTTIEYLSRGTPVICSEGAGSSSLIKHGLNGLKYPPNNYVALASCIEAMISLTPSQYQNMVEEGYKTVNDLLSPKKLLHRNIELYSETISNFVRKKPNVFVSSIYEPSDLNQETTSILDRQPIKMIMKYCMKRIFDKITSKF